MPNQALAAEIARRGDKRAIRKIFPHLIVFLKRCIPRDVPKHAESIAMAVNEGNRRRVLRVLKAREMELKPSQKVRVKRIYKKLGFDA